MSIHQEDALMRLRCYAYVDVSNDPAKGQKVRRLGKIYRWVAHGIENDTDDAPPSTEIINRDEPRIRLMCLEQSSGDLRDAQILYEVITSALGEKPSV